MEFAYNNAPSATTSVSPFFANKGYYPNITVHPKHDIASSWAHNFAVDLDKLQSTFKAEISTAQQYYQKSADAWHSPAPDFKVGDKVFVKAQFFQTTQPSKKLSEKYLGPYKIISQPGTLSFTLHLPESMRFVHPVFHVSMLEPATSNTFSERIQLAPTPVIIDRKPEYEISQIVNSKINCQRACKLLYKVIWLGYEDTGDESKWIPTSELTHAVDLVSDFHIAYLTKPGSLPLSWTHCCNCSLSPCISNRDFPSLISSIFCPLIFINPQLLRTFRGFLFKLQTSFHFNSCLFLLTHLIHRKNKVY